MTKQMAFYFDASACNGCKACVVACKSKNQLPVGINWRRVTEYGGGSWIPDPEDPKRLQPNNIFAYSVSISCNHCENPICMESCPTAAISKRDDGVVLIDDSKCIGCRYCEWACPYGAPQFDAAAGVMTKCNFCEDLLAEGESPYCVSACVMRALDYGELSESASQVWQRQCHRAAAHRRPHQPRVGHHAASPCSNQRRGNRSNHFDG